VHARTHALGGRAAAGDSEAGVQLCLCEPRAVPERGVHARAAVAGGWRGAAVRANACTRGSGRGVGWGGVVVRGMVVRAARGGRRGRLLLRG